MGLNTPTVLLIGQRPMTGKMIKAELPEDLIKDFDGEIQWKNFPSSEAELCHLVTHEKISCVIDWDSLSSEATANCLATLTAHEGASFWIFSGAENSMRLMVNKCTNPLMELVVAQ